MELEFFTLKYNNNNLKTLELAELEEVIFR